MDSMGKSKFNVSLSKKIILISVLLMGLFVIQGFFAAKSLNEIKEQTDEITKKITRRQMHQQVMARALSNIAAVTWRTIASDLTPESKKEEWSNVEREKALFLESCEKLSSIATEDGKKIADEFKENLMNYLDTLKIGFDIHEKEGKLKSISYLKSQGTPLRLKITTLLDDRIKINDERIVKAETEIDAVSKNTIYMVWTLTGIGFAIGTLVSYLVIRNITFHINSSVSELKNSASILDGNCLVVADSSAKLSASTTQQAAAIQQTSAATEQINATIGMNSDSVDESNKRVKQIIEQAVSGDRMMSELSAKIEEDSQESLESLKSLEQKYHKITELVETVRVIEEKSKVINDIVFQTKLLSFNASVEAARAGEYGKGFSVVAEEIGNLAKMSGDAAIGINKLVEDSRIKIQSVISETQVGLTKVIETNQDSTERTISNIASAKNTISSIVSGINEIGERVDSIAKSSKEQQKGVDEIASAIRELETSTQKNTLITQKTSNSSDELKNQSARLKDTMNSLEKIVYGKSAA